MTPVNRSARRRTDLTSTHEARIHLISAGVVASYIHDISTATALDTDRGSSRRTARRITARSTHQAAWRER